MKLLFACGGTGGHIFPAFSVAEELKSRNPQTDITYVCGKKDIESAIFKLVTHEKTAPIESATFSAGWKFPFRLVAGLAESAKLIRYENPDLVVGFGGYVSFPVLFMAKLLGKKTLLHEQNVVPGLANKFLIRLSDGIALSYAEARDYFPPHPKLRVTGNPIRSSIERNCREEAQNFFGFSPDKFTILIVGGSQGAESINRLFLAAAEKMDEKMKHGIQVLHLCGKMPIEAVEEAYRRMGIVAKAYSFFDRMDLAYGMTDLAVGRAGATFLAEITAKNIPAILIPYPYGNGHQRNNAEVFSKSHRAIIAEQSDLTPEKLLGFLVEWVDEVKHAEKPQSLGRTNSRSLLADFIEEMIIQ